jgi:hypothetical protein
VSICTRNCIMTGLRFLFRVTLRRLDLAAEIYHIREPQKMPLVMSADETKRLLAMASSLKARVLLSPTYEAAQCLGCSQIDHKLKYSRLLADLWASLNPALCWVTTTAGDLVEFFLAKLDMGIGGLRFGLRGNTVQHYCGFLVAHSSLHRFGRSFTG